MKQVRLWPETYKMLKSYQDKCSIPTSMARIANALLRDALKNTTHTTP